MESVERCPRCMKGKYITSGLLIRCDYCDFEPKRVNKPYVPVKSRLKNWKDLTSAQRKSIVTGQGMPDD